MLSGCAGQPGTQTIGMPALDFQSQPRESGTPIAPVGLPAMAWIPPYVAQVPAATMAVALGASRSSHSLGVIGCPVAGLLPKPDQYPSSLIFSLGMDPSTTRTNGSRSPRSALKNHSRKSSAPPFGPHSKSISGQCTATFGNPGSAPSAISSMLG